MRAIQLLLGLLPILCGDVGAAPADQDPEQAASLRINELQKQYQQYVRSAIKDRASGCTTENIMYRQEWSTLSKKQRLNYIHAVKCLHKKPNKISRAEVPGARSRFDDFDAVHIIRTKYIHVDGVFFQFHRYFTYLYETALRDECGYRGAQPYWDWTLSWQDPRQNPVMDGSPLSMGGNGAYIPNRQPTNTTLTDDSIQPVPPTTGGGCIATGPFANWTANLGNVGWLTAEVGPDHGLGYNPRCVRRDISLNTSQTEMKPSQVLKALDAGDSFEAFDKVVEAADGVHSGGHATIGGLQSDAWASPGDPMFYLHHAQVDRIWTVWQGLNAARRVKQVYGTATAHNKPPSPNVTLETEIPFGVLAANQTLENLASSIDGPFCYMYI